MVMQKIASTFILLTILGFSAFAQEPLSLEEAIARSLKNNYDILIEGRNVSIAENNNSLGEAGFMPDVSLQVNQNNSLNDNVKVATPFALRGQTLASSLNPQLLLNWQMFGGFRAHISKDRLELLQDEAQGNADIVIANTVQAVILGYYKAVLEAERLEEFKKQLDFSADRYEYVSLKSELGSAVTYDKLLEETNYLTDSADYINQILNYENALRDLNFLMGVKEVTKNYDLSTSMSHTPEDYTYENMSNRMYSSNVDLRKQYLTQRIYEYDLALRKSERYPTLNMNVGFSDTRSRNDLSNAYIEQEGQRQYFPADPLSAVTNTYFVNFSLSFTLFNGNRINRAIQNAAIREDIQNISSEKLENSLNRDLAKAVANYDVKKQLFLINSKKVEVAELNLKLSQDKFKNGTINSFDYRTVQNNYLSAQMQKLQSLYNLIDAEIGIFRLTGDLLNGI